MAPQKRKHHVSLGYSSSAVLLRELQMLQALGRTASRRPQAPQVPRKHGGIPRTTPTAELPKTKRRRGKPRGSERGRQGTYEWPVAGMKYIQQCTRVSGIRFFRLMLISSCRYFSYWSLMNFMMGCQLERERNMGQWLCVRDLDHPEPPTEEPAELGMLSILQNPIKQTNEPKTHSNTKLLSRAVPQLFTPRCGTGARAASNPTKPSPGHGEEKAPPTGRPAQPCPGPGGPSHTASHCPRDSWQSSAFRAT